MRKQDPAGGNAGTGQKVWEPWKLLPLTVEELAQRPISSGLLWSTLGTLIAVIVFSFGLGWKLAETQRRDRQPSVTQSLPTVSSPIPSQSTAEIPKPNTGPRNRIVQKKELPSLHVPSTIGMPINEAAIVVAGVIDQFYGDLLTEDEGDRPYYRFKARYFQIETELRALLLRSDLQAKYKDSTAIVQRVLDVWVATGDRHRKRNMYGSAVAQLDRDNFARMFNYTVRANPD